MREEEREGRRGEREGKVREGERGRKRRGGWEGEGWRERENVRKHQKEARFSVRVTEGNKRDCRIGVDMSCASVSHLSVYFQPIDNKGRHRKFVIL